MSEAENIALYRRLIEEGVGAGNQNGRVLDLRNVLDISCLMAQLTG